MDRVVLLALLGIPVLVIIHIALFWQQPPWDSRVIPASFSSLGQNHPALRGTWRSPERAAPSHILTVVVPDQG